MKKLYSITLLLGSLILFSSCLPKNAKEQIRVDGSKTSVYNTLSLLIPEITSERPTAPLGIYSSIYLGQGIFLPVKSAKLGIESQEKLLAGQIQLESSETFSLLKEFGVILQVDVIDILNRSTNREETLDKYIRSLANIMTLADRKIKELETLEDKFKDEVREKKRAVRDMERIVTKALRNEEFELAGSKQEELTEAKIELAKKEAELDRVKDVLKPYKKMLEIGQERLNAINKNKRILIAGLKVVEVPGIEELDILEQENWRESKDLNFDLDVSDDSVIFGD